MTLCKFFQQGTCRFGNSCRFEHPSGGGGTQPSSNRFSPLGGNGQFQRSLDKYSIKLDVLEADLTNESPTWILSAYAPGRDAPDQLFGGAMREQSFEEMRLHYSKAKAEGNEQRALSEAQELYQNAQAQIQTAVRNVSEAAKYVVEGENRHPNRFDVCRQGTQGAPFGEFLVGRRPVGIALEPNSFASNASTLVESANPFTTTSNAASAPSSFGGGAAPTTTSAFGQPSALGQRPNPFGGTPAFAQPAQPAPGFGGQPAAQPSAFGQPAAQPSAFSQAAQQQPSPFAQPAAAAQSSTFGQPSTLGAKPSPFGAPAFGQPAQVGGAQTTAFGQPSRLGQQQNPFGGNANAGLSPFAAAAASNSSTPANPFAGGSNVGSSPFAAASSKNDKPAVNPFGSPVTNNQVGQPAPNPFGSQTPAQNKNASPFGQASATPIANPFASSAPSSTPAGNPFATGDQQAGNRDGALPNPFAAAQPNNATVPPNPFGAAPANPAQPTPAKVAPGGNPYPPGSAKQHPAAESYIRKNMDGRLAAFKGKAVTYNEDQPGVRALDGTWARIWFPGGPPAYYKDTEAAAYDETSRVQWRHFEQTGQFADSVMPLLPPPRECTVWDF